MTPPFRSIRQKLTRVALLSVGIALLLSTLGAALYELVSVRSRTRGELLVLADVIAGNTTAALAFNDAKAASESLATLRTDPRIVVAALNDRNGKLFASYTRSRAAGAEIPAKTRNSRFSISRAVVLDGESLGTIRLDADLSDVQARLLRYAALMALVAIGSFLTAFLLSSRMNRLIATPILKLAQTATEITNEQDYSLRFRGTTDDEVGLLIGRFNEMLSQIEARDRELAQGRAELEQRVQERTQELEHQVVVRTRAEHALAEQAEELARSNTDLQQFAYVASHDLQEPLRMVASYLQLISRRYRGKLDSNADEFIDFAVDGARRMQSLIQDLLSYSRVGSQASAYELVDTNLTFADAVSNLKVAIEESAARVSSGPLPSVWADPTQLIQLLQNLIGNAIKFRGARIPEVHVSAERAGSAWTFSVQDNGIGIEPQYADRIFTIFQRLHTREEYSGTGIGLAVCKKIAERHRGRIWMESTAGQGTVFHFTIGTSSEDAKPSGRDRVAPGAPSGVEVSA